MTSPVWIPLISAGAGLVGTGVGAAATYMTTSTIKKRELEAEQQRERKEQITDLAVRFIQSVSKQSVTTLRIDQQAADIRKALKDALDSDDAQKAFAALKDDKLDASNVDDLASQVALLSEMLSGLESATAGLSDSYALIAEMRLILPSKVVHIAELVLIVGVMAEVASNVSKGKRSPAGVLTTLLNYFINAIRKELGIQKFVERPLRGDGLALALKELENDLELKPQ